MNARPQAASDLPQRLGAIVGARGMLTDAADMAPYLADWRTLYQGRAIAVGCVKIWNEINFTYKSRSNHLTIFVKHFY